MPNIRVDTSYTIVDGSEVVFTAPCNCNEADGLKVYYPGGSKVFAFKDAHKNALTGLGNLFAEGALVKAILDVSNSSAYIQNADTNAYLEAQLASKAPAGYGYGGTVIDTNTIATTTEAELETILTQMLSQMAAYEAKQIRFKCSALGDWSFCGTLFKTGDYYGSMNAFAGHRDTVIRVSKSFFNSEWCPIEWDNPLMLENTEYRTTKRYQGKAVYTKAINIGALPNNSTSSAKNLSTYGKRIVSSVLSLESPSDGRSANVNASNITFTVAQSGDGWLWFSVKTTKDESAWNGILTIEYTKD